jgi:hypothetical protein
MLTNQEVKSIPKQEFDSLCPYCGSRAVYLVDAHRTASDAPGEQGARAGAYVEDWCCAICYRSFELT